MKTSTASLLAQAVGFAGLACAQDSTGHAQLNGMTVFGYQGWYPIEKQGGSNDNGTASNYKWFSPANGVTPGPPTYPDKVLTDALPYTLDYPAECTLDTNFILADGTSAQFFDSFCTGVIEAHFQYMQKYKIDGVFVQRFFSAATPSDGTYPGGVMVLNTVRQMAEKYGKYFAVEYDLSQLSASSDHDQYIQILENDYAENVQPLFNSSSYIYQDGRPVLEIWGCGINSDPSTALPGTAWQEIIDDFHNGEDNPWLILGIPHNWLDYNKTGNDPTDNWGAYEKVEALQPWPVGAFSSVEDLRGALQNELLPGKQMADSMGIKYSGAFTPGGSNRNAARTATDIPPLGNRYNGTFYEEELKLFTNETIVPFFNFGAMFDEYTEGTQILPMQQFKNLPTNPNPGFFGSDDDKDVFYYMELSGQYTATLHELWGQEALSP